MVKCEGNNLERNVARTFLEDCLRFEEFRPCVANNYGYVKRRCKNLDQKVFILCPTLLI